MSGGPTITSSERAKIEKRLAMVLIVAVVVCFPIAMIRVAGDSGGTDFPEFHAAGRYVLEHRERHPQSILHRYLPTVDVAWALFGWMPLPAAAVVWYLLNCGIWVGLLRSIGRYLLPAVPTEGRCIVLLAAALLTIVFTLDHLLLGAFHLLMLWLMVEGLGRAMQGSRIAAPVLLGTAIWLKLLPLLGAGYLILKRRWGAAIGSVAVALVLDLAISLGVYGPSAAWSAHVRWWGSRAIGDIGELLSQTQPAAQQRDRNQSSAAVLRRLLTTMGIRPDEPSVQIPMIPMLSPKGLRIAYLFGLAAISLPLLLFLRRPARDLAPVRWSGEVAIVVLSTLWYSPIVFSYHPTAAMPALSVVLGARWEQSWLRRIALLIWLVGMVLMAVPQARAAGEILWASLAVGLAVAITCRQQEQAAEVCVGV